MSTSPRLPIIVSNPAFSIALVFISHLASEALGLAVKLCLKAFRDGDTGSNGGEIDVGNIAG
jgi:hypothetical protein